MFDGLFICQHVSTPIFFGMQKCFIEIMIYIYIMIYYDIYIYICIYIYIYNSKIYLFYTYIYIYMYIYIYIYVHIYIYVNIKYIIYITVTMDSIFHSSLEIELQSFWWSSISNKEQNIKSVVTVWFIYFSTYCYHPVRFFKNLPFLSLSLSLYIYIYIYIYIYTYIYIYKWDSASKKPSKPNYLLDSKNSSHQAVPASSSKRPSLLPGAWDTLRRPSIYFNGYAWIYVRACPPQ